MSLQQPFSVLGMGNALMDILVRLDTDYLLNRLNLPKGSMTLVDREKASVIFAQIRALPKSYAAGGSAANTINGLANLGTPTAYIGSVGKDDLGNRFTQSMAKHNTRTKLIYSTKPTGHAITFITPDSERTFATYLGAAIDLSAGQLNAGMFAGHRLFHIEGYLIENHSLILRALQLAKEADMEISYDMASFNVVAENKDFIGKILSEYVDIVFSNEEEARVFTDKAPEDALEELAGLCKTAIVKIGAHGSLVKIEEESYFIKAISAVSRDTTGAGDLYAAGFLYGYINGLLPEQCGKIGSLTGGKVIETIGTKMSEETWSEIIDLIQQIKEE